MCELLRCRPMVNTGNNEEMTCKDIESEEFLNEYSLSEEFHDFQETNEEQITDLSFCEVLFVEEECSSTTVLVRSTIRSQNCSSTVHSRQKKSNGGWTRTTSKYRQQNNIT